MLIIPINNNPVKKGEVVLYVDSIGKLIGHRFYNRTRTKECTMFLCKGDANLSYDMPIQFEQIIGKLVLIQRHGKVIEATDLESRLWGSLMIYFPIVSKQLGRIAQKKHMELRHANAN